MQTTMRRTKPRRALFAVLLAIAPMFCSQVSHGAVDCVFSNVLVETHDTGATWVHGTVNGVWQHWVSLCGTTAGQADCTTRATDRRLGIALAAQLSGQSLLLNFASLTSCSQISHHMVVTGVRLLD
jgi:hypothetical protein